MHDLPVDALPVLCQLIQLCRLQEVQVADAGKVYPIGSWFSRVFAPIFRCEAVPFLRDPALPFVGYRPGLGLLGGNALSRSGV